MRISLLDRLRGKVELPENDTKSHISWDSGEPVPPAVLERIRFGGTGHHAEVYRQQPAVRAVVDLLARNIAQLNGKVYSRRGDDDRVELNDHPVAQLLRKPNPQATRYRHMRDTVADIAINDYAYWLKGRARGSVFQIARIAPSRIHRHFDERTGQVVYRLGQQIIPERDLVVFQGYSPNGDSLGVSPMETLRRVLAEEWEAVRHREAMWRNAARVNGTIRRPLEAPEWGERERKRFRQGWEAAFTGPANSGKTPILEDGMFFDAHQAFSPKETEYIAGRRLTYEEVAVAFGGAALAALVTGREGQVGGEEAKAFQRQLYQDVLGPWLRNIQDEIEHSLVPEFVNDDVYVEYNLQEKLKGSFEEQASVLATSVGVPFMSTNDARSRLNMPRVETGDEETDRLFDIPVMPMNVIYGGQQSTQEPVEDPSTPPGLLSRQPNVKAAPRGAVRRREETADQFEKLFRDFFAHVEGRFVSGKAADDDRWGRWVETLDERLFPASVQVANRMGRLAARQIGGTYDTARTLPFLMERSRIAAEGVVENLRAAVEDSDDLAHTFDVAKTSQAERLGVTTATGLIAFARTEAARHTEDDSGRRFQKRWVVASGNSRHPEWDGMTAPVGEPFPNGAKWPGDPELGVEQTAGCTCLMNIEAA